MTPITFDAETHTYTVQGRSIPSVTQVLSSVLPNPYATVSADVLEYARARGIAVDLAVQELLAGGTLEGGNGTEVVGYLLSYQRWAEATGWRSIAHQVPLYDAELNVCGTPDEIGWLNGRVTIMDWKAVSSFLGRYNYQCAAYGRMWNQANPTLKATQGRVLLLQRDGSMAKAVPVDVEVYKPRWVRLVQQFQAAA